MFCTALIIRIKLVYLITKIFKFYYHVLIAKFEMRFDLCIFMAHEHVGNKVRGDLVLLRSPVSEAHSTARMQYCHPPSEMIPCIKTKLSWNSFTI